MLSRRRQVKPRAFCASLAPLFHASEQPQSQFLLVCKPAEPLGGRRSTQRPTACAERRPAAAPRSHEVQHASHRGAAGAAPPPCHRCCCPSPAVAQALPPACPPLSLQPPQEMGWLISFQQPGRGGSAQPRRAAAACAMTPGGRVWQVKGAGASKSQYGANSTLQQQGTIF